MNMIWLTTPEGNAYFSAANITAVTETLIKGATSDGKPITVRSRVYLQGVEEGFNVLEDCETVIQRMIASEDGAKPEYEETEE
jgi:hypothetical protein